MVVVSCFTCGAPVKRFPSTLQDHNFCSYRCSGIWRKSFISGNNHPAWVGGERTKICQHCGRVFSWRKTQAISLFRKQKFCSRACADTAGIRHRGRDNPRYRADARRRNRGGEHHRWVNAVISRDKATCQTCGASSIELHAHHIKSYRDHPELRFDVSNGTTLCYKCHWELHSALKAKAVNSVNTRKGNTEPSIKGNLVEGVTTRGRAYRRWVGKCDFCGATISKRLSEVAGKRSLFCSGSCRSKWFRKTLGPIPRQ